MRANTETGAVQAQTLTAAATAHTGTLSAAEPHAKTLTPAQIRKKHAKQNALLRAALQAVFFVSMPGAFMAGFSGAKDIFTDISTGSVIELNNFTIALIGLCAFTIVFGRFFCGYACAFGTLGDLVYWVSGLVQKKVLQRGHAKKQFQIPGSVSEKLRYCKYVVLTAILVSCGLGVYGKINQYNWNPWTVFSFWTSLKFTLNGYVIGGILLALIIAGMACKERFFCQFLCPMGAIFSLLPQLPFAALSRDADNCIKGCSVCKRNCPVNIKLEKDGFLNGECISCERCAGACPRGNIDRWDRKLLRSEAAAVIAKAALMFALGVFIGACRWIA